MQWSSLALEEPPSWSWLRPLVQVSMLYRSVFKITKMWFSWHHIWVQQIWVLFSLWKGNCGTFPWENQSCHEQWSLETSKKHRFPKQFWPFFTRKWFRRDKYATCGLRVTLQHHSYHNVPIRLSVLTLTFANGRITEVQQRWVATHLPRHDWKWGSEPIFAVLQCKANSW